MPFSDKRSAAALPLGFRYGDRGTHTSRTMMLAELRILLDACPAASYAAYRRAIVGENILGKRTAATRLLTAQRLSELYSLDPTVPLFRLLRTFWFEDAEARPMLAFLCACARDPLLRLVTPAVLEIRPGEAWTTKTIEAILEQGDRFSPSTRSAIARNAASSFTQAGFLRGHRTKVRVRPVGSPAAAAYAVCLGYLEGKRGAFLFDTFWARLLDRPPAELTDLVIAASRLGWLDYRGVGSVVEVQLRSLLTQTERELADEQA